jgi:hypothetical protein
MGVQFKNLDALSRARKRLFAASANQIATLGIICPTFPLPAVFKNAPVHQLMSLSPV